MTQVTLPLSAPVPMYHGPLRHLIGLLTQEASKKPIGVYAFRQLPHGALIAVKMDHDNRRVLRIARDKRPDSERGLTRWASEISVFLHYFGAEQWESLPADEAVGIAARFRELFPGESRPGFALCSCKAEIPYDHVWGSKQRCYHCALRAGQEETRAIQEGRSDG